MFMKLIKHEIKNSYRGYLSIFLVCLVLSPISAFYIGLNADTGSTAADIFFILLTTLFMGLLFGSFFVSMAFSIRRYHNTMFGKESYITHAIPVSVTQIYFAKLLTSIFWILMTLVNLALCGTIFLLTIALTTNVNIAYVLNSLFAYTNIGSLIFNTVKYTLYFSIATASTLASIFMFDTLVQTQKTPKHRVAIAVGSYLLYNILIQSIFGAIGFNYGGIVSILSSSTSVEMLLPGFEFNIDVYLLINTVINIAFIGIYFTITKYILDRKVDVQC